MRVGFDAHSHRRNLNVLVVGGSGAGKTRFYCKPNAMNTNTGMVILDCKGEITRNVGHLLKKNMEVREEKLEGGFSCTARERVI